MAELFLWYVYQILWTIVICFQGDIKIDIPQKSECVKVVVRCRPMSEKEKNEGFER